MYEKTKEVLHGVVRKALIHVCKIWLNMCKRERSSLCVQNKVKHRVRGEFLFVSLK